MPSTKNKKFLIIDAHAVLHRAYHALPPLKTKKNVLVNAVYGFLLVFFKALKELRPDFVVAAFDLPGPTFRHKRFKEYKATRPKTPEELCQQIPKVKEILKGFNVSIFEKQGFEADDVIGTIQKNVKCQASNVKSIILTGDLDLLQLVNEDAKVYAIRRGVKDTVLYDADKVQEKYQGLKPSQLLDFKALRGDPSDNIPGVPGVGEKTAIQLIKQFGSLENLYKNLEGGSSELQSHLRTKLLYYKRQAFMSRDLAKIKKNVPLDFNLKKCRWGKYDKAKVIPLLEKFEFYSLVKRLPGTKTSKENLKLL